MNTKYHKDLDEAAEDKEDFYHREIRPTNNPKALVSSNEIFGEGLGKLFNDQFDDVFGVKDNE